MAQKKRTPTGDPAVKRCIDAYHQAFHRRHGVKPLIAGGKDGALMRAMVATWGEDDVMDLIVRFVQSNDTWAVRRGWTIAALHDLAPRLMTRRSALDPRTASNIDAAERAMGRE